jgi:hypothetical protein
MHFSITSILQTNNMINPTFNQRLDHVCTHHYSSYHSTFSASELIILFSILSKKFPTKKKKKKKNPYVLTLPTPKPEWQVKKEWV